MIALDIVIILVLIGINGLLAMSELAVVSARSLRLSQRANEGNAGARVALELARDPNRFLSTIQIGITLVAILSGAYGGATLGGHIAPIIQDLGVGERAADRAGFALAVVAITYLSLVFGEIVPKRVALQSPEAVASLVSRPMRLLSTVSAPLVAVLSASTTVVLGILGLHKEREDSLTDEEIRLMIGISAQAGSVEEDEAALLDRVFHFGDRQAHEVMTPRNLGIGIDKGATIEEFYTIYLEHPHSRFPVFDESPDRVAGILGIKDVLAAVARGEIGRDDEIDTLIREALFVPETKPIDDLFREMQAAGSQMAIVVDEFGGTAGIVTLEQLLEEMVGQVHDELAPRTSEITRVDSDTVLISGALSIDEARSELGIDFPEGAYDTVAGYVLGRLGHIPKVGETLDLDQYRLTVMEMRNVRIEQLRLTRLAGTRKPA